MKAESIIGLSSSLPLLLGLGGELVCESVGKADRLTTFVFRWSEVIRLLLDLDPYRCTDPFSMFPLFLKRTVHVLAVCLYGICVSKCFGGLFVWVVSQLTGDRPMSPQFCKVHRPSLSQTTDRFP